MPVAKCNLSVVASADDRCSPAVLLRPIDPVGKLIINGDVIELSSWLVVPTAPCPTAINRNNRSLVYARNHALRVLRIDPERVVIIATWSASYSCEFFPAVSGTV